MDAVSMCNVITLLLYLSALEKKEGKKEIFCFHLIASVSIGFRVKIVHQLPLKFVLNLDKKGWKRRNAEQDVGCSF